MAQKSNPSRRISFNPGRWLWLPLLAVAVVLLVWAHEQVFTSRGRYAVRDWMSLWGGGRAVLERVNPYAPDDWLSLRARYGSTWMPDDRAPFPLWTLMGMTALAWLPLDWAAATWLVLCELMVGISVFLLLAQHRANPSPPIFALLTLSAFFLRGTLTSLNNGQITFVLLLALALFIFLSRRGQPFWAGVALSLILLKPNPFVLFAPLMGVWLLARRHWAAIAGGLTGTAAMGVSSWLLRPGWPGEWLDVRGKTEVTFQTPTVWGLAFELSPAWWPLIGLGLTVLLTGGLGWLILRRREWDEAQVVGLALVGSLLATPYAWAYEHALLAMPMVWLVQSARPTWKGRLAWIALTLLPWLCYALAVQRGRDTLSAGVPLAVGIALLWLNSQEGEEHHVVKE